MFQTFLAVPLHFAIEFTGFLVLAGAAILAITRPSLIPGDTNNRYTAALGFGVLAAVSAAHGGSFAENLEGDGAQILVVARALGFALVMIGIVGGLRAGAGTVSAAAPFSIESPLPFLPAAAALALGVSSLASSMGSGPRYLRRLSIGAFLLAIAEVLTAADPDVRFGAEQIDAYAYAAHGVKLLAYIAISAWLWRAARSSIRTRFVVSFAVLLVLVVLALSAALTGVLSNNVEQERLTTLQNQLDDVAQDIEITQTQETARDVSVLATTLETVQNDVRRGGNLNGLAEGIIRDLPFLNFDFVMFTDERGRSIGFAQSGRKLRKLDVTTLSGSAVVNEVVSGAGPRRASPIALDRGKLAIVAAHGVITDGDLDGIVVGGRIVDEPLIEALANRLAADMTLVVGKRVVSTLPDALTKGRLVPGRVGTQLEQLDQTIARQQTLGDDIYYSAFSTIDSGGQIVGTMILSSKASAVGGAREALTRILFLVAMAVGSIVLVLAWLSGRRITQPIQSLTKVAGAVREGDLAAQAPVTSDDEVGRLGETFNEMTSSLRKLTSDLREAAREEHQLRARIETIMQSMADGLVATDADHRIVAFNREAEVITGVKARHALGKPVEDVLSVRDARGDKARLPIYDLSRGSVDNVFLERRSGERVPIAVVSAVLTEEEGAVAGGVAVVRDMTREREVERMKTEFLSNISHELRTPLTPIKGYAEILTRKDVPNEKAKKFASGILESTGRLERIVELLVDFSAMEAGRLSPRTQPVDIGGVIEELADKWRERAPQHEFVTDVEAGVPRVAGDERLLRRSLQEVVDNAVKFSPHGGTITLAAKGVGSNGNDRRHGSVDVIVSDEGIGIAPEDLPTIFSDFHQLDGSETRTFGGLGLGLAFVHRIIEAHQGSIDVESQVDEGSRFIIHLPAARRQPAARPEGSEAAPVQTDDEPAKVQEGSA